MDEIEEKILKDLEESERQYKEGKIHNIEDVFKELRDKYGY